MRHALVVSDFCTISTQRGGTFRVCFLQRLVGMTAPLHPRVSLGAAVTAVTLLHAPAAREGAALAPPNVLTCVLHALAEEETVFTAQDTARFEVELATLHGSRLSARLDLGPPTLAETAGFDLGDALRGTDASVTVVVRPSPWSGLPAFAVQAGVMDCNQYHSMEGAFYASGVGSADDADTGGGRELNMLGLTIDGYPQAAAAAGDDAQPLRPLVLVKDQIVSRSADPDTGYVGNFRRPRAPFVAAFGTPAVTALLAAWARSEGCASPAWRWSDESLPRIDTTTTQGLARAGARLMAVALDVRDFSEDSPFFDSDVEIAAFFGDYLRGRL